MKCPFCGYLEQRVLNSRTGKNQITVRRRRECERCKRRFSTLEEIEKISIYVLKRAGSKELFDSEKLLRGLMIACRRRPVSIDSLNVIVESIRQDLIDKGKVEVLAHSIGILAMNYLKKLDEVAYIRFASVYKDFKSINEFIEIICSIRVESMPNKRLFRKREKELKNMIESAFENLNSLP